MPGRSRLAAVGLFGLAAIVGWWTWRALHDPRPWDTGLAYQAGTVAWGSGHPEHLSTWNGMPFLAAVMALLGRAISEHAAADVSVVLSLALWVGAMIAVLRRLRRLVPTAAWWIVAFGLASFAPLMSTIWFKQFNAIALVLALVGFDLVRRGRGGAGAAALGVSIAVKPMVILLPFVMLLRRETRRAGGLALAWVAALNVAAQAFMALRAHDLATLDPLIGLRNFLHKTGPSDIFVCAQVNFAPGSLLCRAVGGTEYWTWQRIAVAVLVLLLGLWLFDGLRGRDASSWEVFAFVCPLSVMLGPLAWSHYQIMLAPLFVLLFVRFVGEEAGLGAWAGLIVAFALGSLMWDPYGSVVGAVSQGVSGAPQSSALQTFLYGIAQFSQYILVVTAAIWYARRRALVEHETAERLAI